MRPMGFYATAAQMVIQAANDYQQSRAYKAQAHATGLAGEAQARILESQAARGKVIAMENDRMQRRNARSELSAVRADNAASNLLSDGTGFTRELDMATRLEHEINSQTDAALRQSSDLSNQAAYTRWDAGVQAQNLRRKARGSNLSALGNLVGSMAQIGFGMSSLTSKGADAGAGAGGKGGGTGKISTNK